MIDARFEIHDGDLSFEHCNGEQSHASMEGCKIIVALPSNRPNSRGEFLVQTQEEAEAIILAHEAWIRSVA